MVKSTSLGPWTRDKDIRLFSYRNTIHKIRLFLKRQEAEDTNKPPKPANINSNSEILKINNPQLQSEIDRCVAIVLKTPPETAIPMYLNFENVSFTVEVRSWRPPQKLVLESQQTKQKIWPFSFKISGSTSLPFFIDFREEVVDEVYEVEDGDDVGVEPEREKGREEHQQQQNEHQPEIDVDELATESQELQNPATITHQSVPEMSSIAEPDQNENTTNTVDYTKIEPDESVVSLPEVELETTSKETVNNLEKSTSQLDLESKSSSLKSSFSSNLKRSIEDRGVENNTPNLPSPVSPTKKQKSSLNLEQHLEPLRSLKRSNNLIDDDDDEDQPSTSKKPKLGENNQSNSDEMGDNSSEQISRCVLM